MYMIDFCLAVLVCKVQARDFRIVEEIEDIDIIELTQRNGMG